MTCCGLQVLDAVQRVRGQIAQAQHAADSMPPAAPPPYTSRGREAALPAPRPPPAPPASSAVYQDIIRQAAQLGYAEAKAQYAASQLQAEGRPADLNVLLDRLERLP